MEDSPEDLPKPPRRAAARPFFSPRPSGEGVTGPLELRSRRAAQLFTPPGASPATPPADRAMAPESTDERDVASHAADGAGATAAEMPEVDDESSSDADDRWTPSATLTPEETLDAESLLVQRSTLDDDDRLMVEPFEHEEIELRVASATTVPDEHLIEVIGYDDANSLLKAAANEGERPEVDGLRIETTEFSFQDAAVPRLNVETFWATEPFGAADVTESAPSSPAAEAIEERAVEGAEMALDSAEIAPDVDQQSLEWGEEEQPNVDVAPPLADSTPPWVSRATPASSQSLEELKESEPWSVSPTIVESEVDDAPTFDEPAHDEPAHDEPAHDEPAHDEPAHDVADALERIAARVRGGEIDVPAGSESSDAAALAAVLTALLRLPR